MLANFGGWHAVIIILVVLLLFGATKLPALARSMGQSMKIFKNEIKSDKVPDATAPNGAAGQATAADGTVHNGSADVSTPGDGTQPNNTPTQQ